LLEDDALVERIAAERIPLTVYPLSNVQLKVVAYLPDDPLPTMLKRTLCEPVRGRPGVFAFSGSA
jgi:adenosine deaminase